MENDQFQNQEAFPQTSIDQPQLTVDENMYFRPKDTNSIPHTVCTLDGMNRPNRSCTLAPYLSLPLTAFKSL